MKHQYRLILLFFVLVHSTFSFGVNIEKTIRVTVGSSFKISPWSDVSSKFSGYTCASTSLKTPNSNSFTINVYSTTKTRFPGYSTTGYVDGFYSTYKIEALEVGTFSIDGIVSCHKRSGSDHYVGSPIVTYHIVVSEAPKVTSISIPSNLELYIDESYTVSPVISEEGASTTLVWNSSNPSVANINNGVITGLNTGTSIVTCTASNGVSAQCMVKVNPNRATQIILNESEGIIEKEQTLQLEAYLLPENVTNSNIKWHSSDENVAIVSTTGFVAGVSKGWTQITATTTDGSNLSASCLIRVTDPAVLATSLTLNATSLELTPEENTTLIATLEPSNVSSSDLSWKSSDENVVKVDSMGIITAFNPGNATITVSAMDGSGISASCLVTVRPKYDNKCATPIIGYSEGRITLVSETEGVVFVTNIVAEKIDEYQEEELFFTPTYTVTSYATKEKYENSDTAIVTLCWIECPERHEFGGENGIITLPSIPVFIKCYDGIITLTNLVDNTEVSVYDTTGRVLGTDIASDGVATISTDLVVGSIAIVKFAGRSVTIVL